MDTGMDQSNRKSSGVRFPGALAPFPTRRTVADSHSASWRRRSFRSHAKTWLALAAIITGLVFSGWLDPLDNAISDLRFGLSDRTASGDIVVIGIDSRSLQEIGVWPWRRNIHAEVMDRLVNLGAQTIALDIDFSSRSTPEADGALARSVRAAGPTAVLPVFLQPGTGPGAEYGIYVTAPLPELQAGARLASVNVIQSGDGLVRSAATFAEIVDRRLPTMLRLLAPQSAVPDDIDTFSIDYGIRPNSLPYISYIDVLNGMVSAEQVDGKSVIVGAIAVELGDMLPVPVWQSLPGVVVQALAAESIAQDRMLYPALSSMVLTTSLGLAFVSVLVLQAFSWRAGALLAMTAIASVLGVSVLAGLMTSLQFGAATPALSLVLGFVAVLFRRIDALDLRVIMQNLALLKRSGYMRLIVDNSSDAILTIDDNDRIRSANVAAEAMFSQPAAALLGRGIDDVVELTEGHDDVQDANRLSRPKVFGQHGSLRPGIGRSVVGRRFDVEVSIGTMNLRDEHVSIVTIRDVSERIKAEQKIREADHRLRAAINTLEGGFALFERSGALTLSNEMWQKVFWAAQRNTSTANNYGSLLSKLVSLKRLAIHDDELDIWFEARQAAFRRGRDRFEMPLTNGTWYLVTVAPSNHNQIAVICADVTPLKSREAEMRVARDDAERANRTKSEFLANMSHELRTPLNAIIGFSELMQKEAFGPLGADSYREYMADIHNSGAHLLELINEILDLSKIEAGLLVLNEEASDLSSLVAAAERMIQPKAHEANVALEIGDLSALPDIVVDRAAFKRVLINILSNGVKFTPDGGKVCLSAEVRSAGDLAIWITDTGRGIATEHLKNIMQPFTQVDSAFSRSHEGAGLGLSIVQGILDQHEAAITLESTLGEGTTVTVVLPTGRVLAPCDAGDVSPAAKGGLATA